MAAQLDREQQLAAENQALKAALAASHRQMDSLQQRYQNLSDSYEKIRRLHFGTSSEKLPATGDANQLDLELFNEAEAYSDATVEELEVPGEQESEALAGKPRKKPGRKPIPAHLERIEIPHDVAEADKSCPCCGKARPPMGEERTEEIHAVPAMAVVHVHVRKKYGECSCQGFQDSGLPAVIKGPAPVKIIPGGLFSNETIALVVAAKFADGIPLYRSVKIFGRSGLDTNRATLSNQVLQVGRKIGPLLELMWSDARGSPVIRMDETTVQVLKEPGKKAQSKSYMWVTNAYHGNNSIILYRYHPSREGAMAWNTLEGYSGFLQTDGFAGYKAIGEREGIVHVACWAHIRRHFMDAHELKDADKPFIKGILDLIAELYKIENRLRKRLEDPEAVRPLNTHEFVDERKRLAGDQLTLIRLWLERNEPLVTPKSTLGKAIAYAKGQFERATRYVDHVLLTPDTNPVERAIRPFVVGRNAWLFNDTPRGAHASAGIYSLIITARQNGLEPYEYLCRLFNELPLATDETALRRLLPYAEN